MSARPTRARRLAAALGAIERELDTRNAYPLGAAAVRVRVLERWLAHGRRPRVLMLGRRGAGKSTLVNALCGAAVSEVGDVSDATGGASVHSWRAGARVADLWDVPGLRAGGRSEDRRRVVAALARAIRPDVVFALFQASEVDAGIDDDARDVQAVLRAASGEASSRGRETSLIALVTKVDELAPPDVLAPPFDADDEKRGNIERSVDVLRSHLERHGLRPEAVHPVNAYVRFHKGTLEEDLRWNLEPLGAMARSASGWLDDDGALEDLRAELAGRLAEACEDAGALFGSLAASEATRGARAAGPTTALPSPSEPDAPPEPSATDPSRALAATIHDGPEATLAALDRLLAALAAAARDSGASTARSAWDSLRHAFALRVAAGALPRAGVTARSARIRARAEVVSRRYARDLRESVARWSLENVAEVSREVPA